VGLKRVERNRHGSAGCGAFTGKVTVASLTTMMAPTNPVECTPHRQEDVAP
jgi:hypothetical protein